MYMYLYGATIALSLRQFATPAPVVTPTLLRKNTTVKVTDDEAVELSEPLPPSVEVKSGEEPRTIETTTQGCVEACSGRCRFITRSIRNACISDRL